MRTVRLVSALSIIAFFSLVSVGSGAQRLTWYAGTWDSTINNLLDHPRTVALRIEVLDKETREPIPDANISFEGEYCVAPRTSRHPEGEREAQEMEYKVTCRTDSDGIAVGAFGWEKEYPWSLGTDEIEKAQRIEVRHSRYSYIEMPTPFYRFLDAGQQRSKPYPTGEDTLQDTQIFETFKKTWASECAKRDVKFFVLDLGTDYEDFDNKESVRPEFFERIRDKKWSFVIEKPRNMMKWGLGDGRSWCGPYFVYLIEIQMERRRGQIEVISKGTGPAGTERMQASGPPTAPANAGTDSSPAEPTFRVWQCPACGHNYRADAAPKFCPQCGYSRATDLGPGGEELIAPADRTDDESIESLRRIAQDDPLGIAVEKLTPQLATALFGFPYALAVNMSIGNLVVRHVLPGSPAEKAGLKKNDIFVSVKLPDQGFYSMVMFNSVDDYRKMFNYQVMRNAVILDVSGFQFPEGYRHKQSDAIYDYFFRTDIEWNKGANALNGDFSRTKIPESTQSDSFADQEKNVLGDTLKGISEISLPSFDQIKKDPSALFELMAAFKKAKQDVTIASIRAIPVKDPDTGEMTTFDQFARKAISGMDLGSTGSFFQDDPIAATYMMIFDKKFLLEKVPLIKMPDGEYLPLMDVVKNSDIAGENSEVLKKAVDGLTSAYSDGKSGAVLVALEEVLPVLTAFSGKQAASVKGQEKTIDCNGVSMELVLVPASSFMMGSPDSERDRHSDEGPVHRVQITKPFYMSKYEVTQDQYMAVTGKNPSHFSGRNLPVDSVTWNEAAAFCARIGKGARLPTEAEWEYACRAGSQTRFYYGDDPSYTQLGNYAWYEINGEHQTHTVGQKKPNSFGLYDMHGNVWEWCADWYESGYKNASCVDPMGPYSTSDRVFRGGGWFNNAMGCRSATRHRGTPDARYGTRIGFRIVLDF